jgi:hypothetical protein
VGTDGGAINAPEGRSPLREYAYRQDFAGLACAVIVSVVVVHALTTGTISAEMIQR